MTSYNGRHFKYGIRKFMYGKIPKYFINVYIECGGVYYQLAQKNNFNFGADDEETAKRRIQKILKRHCVGTPAELPMKKLPIFDDGYQETLF